jgi:Ca-activated chloride channel family protein
MTRILRWTLFALVLAGGAAYPCFMYAPQPVHVSNDHIEIAIKDQVAVKTYHCTFKNPNPRAVVGGTCYMEVEPGAQVDKMTLTVNGVETPAELLDVQKAKQVFTDIVRNGGSPALLEFYGKQLIRTNIPHVPPRGTVLVKLQYTTVLESRGGLVRLSMLNTNPKALMQPLEEASVKVTIRSAAPITNLYSPTHDIKIVEDPKADVAVTWSQKNYLPKKPFVLYYALSERPIGMNLLAHKPAGEAGSFMLMLSPVMGGGTVPISTHVPVAPKDIVFCVDTSGSMIKDGKMEQARAALKHCLRNLRPEDRFAVVSFGTEARTFEPTLSAATPENVERALAYADGLAARGGTAIEEALGKSLAILENGPRLKMILFATDGMPTIGEGDTDKLARKVREANARGARIFVFGEGYDVNTKLLDVIASENRGDAEYIMPEEDIASRIGAFYDRVGSPVMTDLAVEVDGAELEEIYPKVLPDLFKGGQIVFFGRYAKGGTRQITVRGKVNGEEQRFTYAVEFPETSHEHDFVPRLWAGRKVAFFLDQMRRNGPNDELIDEVTRLAKRYGILTPYTSFLIAEDAIEIPVAPGRPMLRGRVIAGAKLKEEAEKQYGAAPGASAADRRKFTTEAGRLDIAREAKGGWEYDKAAEAEYRAQGGNASVFAKVRTVNERAFYCKDNTWYDCLYDPEKDKEAGATLKVGSEAYFKLLADDPSVAPYLAQVNVVFNHAGKWYRVSQ